jgi:transcriptional regulator with XRE-family HTH domain
MNQTINERIKKIRKTLGLTQAQFCRGIFLTNGHYAGIELGVRAINERTVKLLATTYGVNENFLKTGEGEMFGRAIDVKLEELTHIFKSLPHNFQDYILRQVRELEKLRPQATLSKSNFSRESHKPFEKKNEILDKG